MIRKRWNSCVASEPAAAVLFSGAVLTAIARHHARGAGEHRAFRLHPAAAQAVREALRVVGEGADWGLGLGPALVPVRAGNLEELLIRRGRGPETVLYFLLVRVLRLADQWSQAGPPMGEVS